MPQHDDDIYLGQAEPGGAIMGTPSATQPLRGIGPAGRVYCIDLGRPVAANAAGVCAAQAIAGVGNALINGAFSSTDFTRGQRTATFTANTKVGICLQMASSNAGDTTQSVLVTGRDIYGARMTQQKTLNGTTAVNFTKAFKWVDIVRVSAAMAGNLTVGTRDAFGFPIHVLEGGMVIKIGWGNVYGPDPGTVTTADATDPATSTTNDVRGFYEPSSAADGTKRLTVTLMLTDGAVGANATRKFAFGVTQA
jgi:hypothetical protein